MTFRKFDAIPIACAVPANRVVNPAAYRFRMGAVGGTKGAAADYYRLGNNATQIECRPQLADGQIACIAGTAYRDVYYQ